jgi:hypothetical protein
MKRGLESNATKGHPKRPRAMDIEDPSRPGPRLAVTNAASSSTSTSRLAVAAAPNHTFLSAPRLDSVAPPKVSQFHQERPHWHSMHQQILHLPANTPHCLRFIIDEALSMSPEEAQSAIQGHGMCRNAYYCCRKTFINHSPVCSIFLAQSIIVSRTVQRELWKLRGIQQDLSPNPHHHRAHQCW